jgi:hypothetical protein
MRPPETAVCPLRGRFCCRPATPRRSESAHVVVGFGPKQLPDLLPSRSARVSRPRRLPDRSLPYRPGVETFGQAGGKVGRPCHNSAVDCRKSGMSFTPLLIRPVDSASGATDTGGDVQGVSRHLAMGPENETDLLSPDVVPGSTLMVGTGSRPRGYAARQSVIHGALCEWLARVAE